VRRLALAIDGASESTGSADLTFLLGDAPFAVVADDRGGAGVSLWAASPAGVPTEMIAAEPGRFFDPAGSGGPTGWLGVRLDGDGDDAVDWDEIAAILDDAVRAVTGRDVGVPIGDPDDLPGCYRFTSDLWLHQGDGAWCFASVPAGIRTAIDGLDLPERRGFGSRRVRVTIGATTWATSIFPDDSNGTYALPVKKAVRKAEHLEAGDRVGIEIELVELDTGAA